VEQKEGSGNSVVFVQPLIVEALKDYDVTELSEFITSF